MSAVQELPIDIAVAELHIQLPGGLAVGDADNTFESTVTHYTELTTLKFIFQPCGTCLVQAIPEAEIRRFAQMIRQVFTFRAPRNVPERPGLWQMSPSLRYPGAESSH